MKIQTGLFAPEDIRFSCDHLEENDCNYMLVQVASFV